MINKPPKGVYKVLDRDVSSVEIKARLTDANEVPYYVYDLYDEGELIALNRYVLTTNEIEMPFLLTEEEKKILNLIIKPEPMEEI